MSEYDRIIKNWQIHNTSADVDFLQREFGPDVKPQILTGTIVEDNTGKFNVGDHFRSSWIIHIDEDNGVVHTVSKKLKLEGPEGDPSLGNADAGDLVMRIYY